MSHSSLRIACRSLLPTALLFSLILMVPGVSAEPVADETGGEPGEVLLKGIEVEWGGHLRGRGMLSWPDRDSFYALVDSGPYQDGSAEFRLKNKLVLGKWGYFETHYEAVLSMGDTRESMNELAALFPAFLESGIVFGETINDDRRLLDLTSTVSEDDNRIIYHRLDRLSLTLLPEWGMVCIGRQAITWGNGLLFNPMDLFNPFSPTDIERDYKVGDDMISAQFWIDRIGEVQLLYVPRRDPIDHDVEWEQSSLAGKIHFAVGVTEFDVMAARHYEDYVIGVGGTGYLGNAAWRADATWTFLEEDHGGDGFLALVANLDYSWIWWEKNFYGLVEFYFNGLGDDDYIDTLSDPDVVERLARGEIFTLGRSYLSGSLRAELHPLFNVYLTVINNLQDPSGIIQPRFIWDVTENSQLTVGANVACGGRETEFGGFEIPPTDILIKSPDSVFLWFTYFF